MTLEPKALEAAAQEAKKWGWATGGPAFTAVLKAFADALPSPNGSGEQVSEAMVERIRNAVLSCSHTIVADEITLRRSEGKDGNALRQLSDRIRVALSASMAGPVHEGWRLITDDPPLDRKFLGASIDALRADGTRRPDNIWLIRGRHIDYAGGPAHWTWNEAEGGGYGIRLTHWHELPPLPAAAALRSLSRTQP